MSQARNGRRGAVFSVRVTDEEREKLEALQGRGEGPRSLGPWLIWRALAASGALPDPGDRVGSTPPASSRFAAGMTTAGAMVRDVLSEKMVGKTQKVPSDSGDPPRSKRLILDLCAGSGSWSAPYVAAGYRVARVTLPDQDVRTFVPPPGPVWGILAAPPCEQFSLARNGHPNLPRDIARGLEVVSACLRLIAVTRPRWWALENPVGLLSRWLGVPRDVWDPCDFGDPWTKRTAIWGDYAIPERGPFVKPLGGGPLCRECDPSKRKTTWCSRPDHRALTPAGFAKAFFLANP